MIGETVYPIDFINYHHYSVDNLDPEYRRAIKTYRSKVLDLNIIYKQYLKALNLSYPGLTFFDKNFILKEIIS